MKNKTVKSVIDLMLLIILFILTGCSNEKKINESNMESESKLTNENNATDDNNSSNAKKVTFYNILKISSIGNGYAFVEKFNGNWDLVDLNGNLVFELPDNYEPEGKVINGYFFCKDKRQKEGRRFYKIDGTQPFEGKEVFRYVAFLGERITTDNYIYIVRTKSSTKDFDGEKVEEKVYCINENLEDYTDKISWKNIITDEGKYAVTSRIMYSDYDDVYNPGFQINPKETKHLDTYIKENNGYFTHMKDDEKLYTPIEGIVYKNYGFSTDVLAKINEKYYIVQKDGNKKEIDYMDGYECSSFYDGYIVASGKGTTVLFNPDGNQIEFNI